MWLKEYISWCLDRRLRRYDCRIYIRINKNNLEPISISSRLHILSVDLKVLVCGPHQFALHDIACPEAQYVVYRLVKKNFGYDSEIVILIITLTNRITF